MFNSTLGYRNSVVKTQHQLTLNLNYVKPASDAIFTLKFLNIQHFLGSNSAYNYRPMHNTPWPLLRIIS